MFATPSPSTAPGTSAGGSGGAGGSGSAGGMFSPQVRADLAAFGGSARRSNASSGNSGNSGAGGTPYSGRGGASDPPGSSSSTSTALVATSNNANPNNSSPPKPRLLTDATHSPKTHGSLGLLIVGIGGANGTTTLAGILANRRSLAWAGPHGQPMAANYNGCVTQLTQRGVHGGVGYADKIHGLADASMAAVGGWDVRPTPLGDALLRHQILDYDLALRVREEMNATKVFRGYARKAYLGPSQHAEATYVLTEREAPTASEALKSIRADIRYFKWRNGVVGHTTVLWSASVEPDCPFCAEGGPADTAVGLLELVELTDEERGGPLPPSLVYALAAVLEGCSFVNGGSQNTLCGGLVELARQQRGVYCLGTDFKAGQTKFKTAAVEYIRTMGLAPRVVASSNHLGNNDMRNLASADAARQAKLRVKHDIFAPWEEDIDHQVSVMYTPHINDDKRDFVEYTSAAFLGQPHTMVTYTRASDSVLCAPLMIDAAVWCDYFSNRSWPFDDVAKALAYLFKVPEGGAMGVDPGFFRQMAELDRQALAADRASMAKKKGGRKVRIRAEESKTATEWAIPRDAGIVCAGLACVDMQLNEATGGDGGEAIETFQGEKSIGGGSVSMACKTLARLTHGEALDAEYMQVTPPAVHSVIPLCKIGKDNTGDKLVTLLEDCGSACRNVCTKYMKSERDRDQDSRTALAVLPIYQDGRRGCFFDAASNATFSPEQLIGMMSDAASGPDAGPIGAFLFGYPHLLPMMQGDSLAQIMSKARTLMDDGGVTALDLNGVPETDFPSRTTPRSVTDLQADPVLGAALPYVDILHMNEDELVNLTGCQIEGTDAAQLEDEFNIASAVSLFLMCGVAVVAVTRGKRGCFISCNDMERFEKSKALPSSWVDCTTKLEALDLPPGTRINTNGAGDSFTAGLLVAALLRHTGLTVPNERSVQTSFQGGTYTDEGTPLSPTTPSAVSFSSPSGPSQQPSPFKSPSPSKPQGKMTPYRMYMKEHYVSLKAQCDDDKRAIFTMCHEMWEAEPNHVKEQYARKVDEEASAAAMLDATGSDDRSSVSDNDTDTSFTRTFDAAAAAGAYLTKHEAATTPAMVPRGAKEEEEDSELANSPNRFMANRSLNLESAAQFATLVAAHHINVRTRDSDHLDLSSLLERSMIVPDGLQEI